MFSYVSRVWNLRQSILKPLVKESHKDLIHVLTHVGRIMKRSRPQREFILDEIEITILIWCIVGINIATKKERYQVGLTLKEKYSSIRKLD